MQPSVSQPTDSGPTVHKTAKSVSDLIADWSPDDVFDAQQILDRNPEFKNDQSIVLDLAYEEYCRRIESGEELDLSKFVARFPDVKTPLLDLIDVHQVLYDNPSVLTGGAAPRWPEVGESHLDLKLIEKIGSGSFSQVYIASESGVGERRVVAKLCTNAKHEASLLGRLEHPNIVPILSVKNDRQKNVSAICMPYMSRTTLAHAIEFLHGRDNRATPRDLIEMLFEREHEAVPASAETSGFSRKSQLQDVMTEIAIQLCRGLEFAHSRGVIHGDLKPSNILLTKQGTALLMDFNLSQKLCPESRALGGTLAYMAPEQLAILSQNQGQPQSVSCNEQTDVYSFGVLLAELFTGSHPFFVPDPKGAPAESARQLFEQQQTKPVTAHGLAPEIGMPLAKIIEKCVAVDPQERWGSVPELRAALEQTTTLKSRTLRFLRRERKRVIGILAAACVLLAASGLIYKSLPTRFDRLLTQAEVLIEQHRPQEAMDLLKDAMGLGEPTNKSDSLFVAAYTDLGNRFQEEARYSQAVEQFEEALGFGPPSQLLKDSLLRAYQQAGAAAAAENRASEAVAYYSEASQLAPGSADILYPLSRAYEANGEFEKAAEAAENWAALEPDNARAIANLAYCHARLGEHGKGRSAYLRALEEFQKAQNLKVGISEAAVLSNIGLCHCRSAAPHEALKPLRAAMKISESLRFPEECIVPYLLYMKARSRIESFKNFDVNRDLDWITECVAENPDSAKLLLEAARCYAIASKESQPNQEASDEYLAFCIDYAERASYRGAKKADLNAIQQLRPQLKDLPRWQRLIASADESTEAEAEDESSLLDPLF